MSTKGFKGSKRPPIKSKNPVYPRLDRKIARTLFRQDAEAIIRRGRDGGELWERLDKFPFEAVRGDCVPTCAEAYWAAIDAINAKPASPQAMQLDLPLREADAGGVKVRVIVEFLNPKTGEWSRAK